MNPMTGQVLNRIDLEQTFCQRIRFKMASDQNWIVAGPLQPAMDDHFLLLYSVNNHETKLLCYPKDQVESIYQPIGARPKCSGPNSWIQKKAVPFYK
jgi:hypothetical protein